ncbi:DUF1592 domain-containing protein [Marinicellulosiphila megalodicopiae]|uniref:DUF1592 domain-containing protein n=1 Tax=Marinicellulosiphila megalodicopiae TaxID=2724896 RepID=UPI003BAF4F9D
MRQPIKCHSLINIIVALTIIIFMNGCNELLPAEKNKQQQDPQSVNTQVDSCTDITAVTNRNECPETQTNSETKTQTTTQTISVSQTETETETETVTQTMTVSQTETNTNTQTNTENTQCENNNCPDDIKPNTDIAEGQELYNSMCVACHDEKGDGGRANLLPSIKDLSFVSITNLTMPEAPLFKPTDCDRTCAEKIKAYLKRINKLDIEIYIPFDSRDEFNSITQYAVINAGGSDDFYFEDDFFLGGTAYKIDDFDPKGHLKELILTERRGDFKYAIPVPDSEYQVQILFANGYEQDPIQNIFHVDIEGSRTLSNFEISKANVKNNYAYVTDQFDVTVSDGELNIDFIPSLGYAKVSGIIVYKKMPLCLDLSDCVPEIDTLPIQGDAAACTNGVDASFGGLIRINNEQYQNTLRDVFNTHPHKESGFSIDEFIGNFKVNTKHPMSNIQIENNWEAAEIIAQDAIKNLSNWMDCPNKDDACADKIIDEIGLKLYRRPLTQDEKLRLKELYLTVKSEQNNFDEGAQYLLVTMLVSPNFLYQLEMDLTQPINNHVVKLNQYEIASRLASFIWRSIPDDVLFEAAKTNQLSSKLQIKTQAERMLADPKAQSTISSFHTQWLGIPKMEDIVEDGWFDEEDYEPLNAGIEDVSRTILDLVFSGGAFQDLFSVEFGYLNEAGKALYDVNAQPIETFEDGFNKYDLAGFKRKGILTRGGFLSSSFDSTRRGKFVRQRLLCDVIPAAPAGISTETLDTEGKSPREYFLELITNPDCAGCHSLMNPIGFGFDHYDEVGKWIDQIESYDGTLRDIDVTGEFFAVGELNQTFEGAEQMQSILASGEQTQACYSYQWFVFANGRKPNTHDDCSIAQSLQFSQAAGGSIFDVIISITQTDAFSHRRTQSN